MPVGEASMIEDAPSKHTDAILGPPSPQLVPVPIPVLQGALLEPMSIQLIILGPA